MEIHLFLHKRTDHFLAKIKAKDASVHVAAMAKGVQSKDVTHYTKRGNYRHVIICDGQKLFYVGTLKDNNENRVRRALNHDVIDMDNYLAYGDLDRKNKTEIEIAYVYWHAPFFTKRKAMNTLYACNPKKPEPVATTAMKLGENTVYFF
jgi:hypothetical protein